MENIYFSTLKMLFVLTAIVSGIILFYRYAGKYRPKLKGNNHSLQKVESIHLGYRKFISVVEVRDRVLVIGVGEKEMCLLADWSKEGKAA